MRTLTLSLILLLAVSSVIAQVTEKSDDQKLFDKAFELHQDEEADSALILFRDFMVRYPESSLLPRVHYNIGYILKEQGRKDEAREVLLDVLNSSYNEKDPGGHGLMGPQYALYKHFSCEQLADLYLAEENYDEAEKYVRMFDKKYPYEHFCGNELTAYRIFKARSYAKVYHGQGKTDKAIAQLVPYIFYNGLANNEELLSDLISLLDEKYEREEIRAELLKSVTTLKISHSRRKGESAAIELLGFTLEVDENGLFGLGNPDLAANMLLSGREKYLKVIQTNSLFKNYGVE